MGNSAGTLYIAIKGDTRDLDISLIRSKKNATSSATSMRKSLNSVGKAAIGVTSAVAALAGAAGLATLASVTRDSIRLAGIQEAAEAKLEAVIRATGGAAGLTADQMKAYASGLQQITTVGDEAIIEGQALLATFKQIRGEGFERATAAALDMSAIMQTDLKSSILQIGKALNDPIRGLTMLTRVGVTFSEGQKEQIKNLQESGDLYGAQSVILRELESQFGGAASALADTYGGAIVQAKNSWGDLKEELGFVITKNQNFIDMVHNVNDTISEMTGKVRDNRSSLQDLATEGLYKAANASVVMADTVLGGINAMSLGFQGLNNVIYGFRATFGIVVKEVSDYQLATIDNDIKKYKQQINELSKDTLSNQFRNTMGGRFATEEVKEKLTAQISLLEERRSAIEINRQAGDQMAADNIAAMDNFNASMEKALQTIANLRRGLDGVSFDSKDALPNWLDSGLGEEIAFSQRTNQIGGDDTGGENPFEKRFEALQESLRSEEEALADSYLERQDLLNNWFLTDMEIAGENEELKNETRETWADAALQVEADYQDQKTALYAKGEAERLKAEQTSLKNLSFWEKVYQQKSLKGFTQGLQQKTALASSSSRTMFEINKAAAISEATIDAYHAIVGAYKVGAKIGGPPLGAAFAVAAGAFEFATIASIASQSYGGGRGGGGMTAGSVPIAPSQLPDVVDRNTVVDEDKEIAPSVTVNYYHYGNNMGDYDEIARELVPAINKAIEDGV